MMPAEVLCRVFRIKVGDASASAFALDVGGRQYLVTARHALDDFSPDSVAVFTWGQWSPLAVQLVGHADGDVDISVLAADKQLADGHLTLPASTTGLTYGQDVFFLGFPYDILGQFVTGDTGYPLPLIKRALVSSMGKGFMLLDGHNNPGFSGGPVAFRRQGERKPHICGVISSYQAVPEPIHYGDEPTDLTYLANTGIIVAYNIEPALDLIAKNPIGCTVAA